MNYANEIKDRVKMPEILKLYGIEMNRYGRIKCPLHGGTDYNCGVKDNYLHCFVCGESVDQIGFIQKYFGLSFMDSIAKLNEDFGLNLPIGKEIRSTQRMAMARANFDREKKRREEEKRKKEIDDAYWSAYDEVLRLSRNQKNFAPKSDGDELNPLYVESLMYIEQAKHELEMADIERYKYEHRNR